MKFLFIFLLFTNVQSKPVNTTIKASYNTIVGYASTNVPAYSNGNDSYISNQPNYLYGVYTGMKWQCVEYARRWLFIRKGCIFDSIDGAADMWTQLDNVQQVVDKKHFKLKKYLNGSPSPPKNESLLIYNRSGVDMPFGHVAIIVDVLPNFIRIAEQNYYFHYWSRNYSRQIQYVFNNGGYYIKDTYPIIGWMSIEDNNQTKPLDPIIIQKIISKDFILQNNGIYHSFSISSYLFCIFFNIYLSF